MLKASKQAFQDPIPSHASFLSFSESKNKGIDKEVKLSDNSPHRSMSKAYLVCKQQSETTDM
jgi:hypothetical protein